MLSDLSGDGLYGPGDALDVAALEQVWALEQVHLGDAVRHGGVQEAGDTSQLWRHPSTC